MVVVMAKVLQGSLSQVINTQSMVRAKDTVSQDPMFFNGLEELFINCIPHTSVCDDNTLKAQVEQTELSIVLNQLAEDVAKNVLSAPC